MALSARLCHHHGIGALTAAPPKVEAPMAMTKPQLKRTLRQLKQLEITFRFGQHPTADHQPLVWDVFFSARDYDSKSVKYPLSRLIAMEHDELRAVIDEYLVRVYSQTAQGQGIVKADVHDPELLAQLGLPPYADMAEIIQRFRTLAKQYHPDVGGESERFIELLAAYERLRNETP
jgi:DnaJ-like protein